DQADGGASLSGNGEINLISAASGGGKVFYNNQYGHTASSGNGIRIHGCGQVTLGGGVNHGTIEADNSVLSLTLTGSGATNQGVVKASHGALLRIDTPAGFTNQGAIAA